ncbi:hypothetical protein JCM11641_003570 [Rhodosporidiobolus odoratus]
MSGYCTACNTSNALENDVETGLLVCTLCGTVSSESASHSFEFLARVNEEDEFQNGRTYVGASQQAMGGLGRMGGKAAAWAAGTGESKVLYHAKKKNDADYYIRRLLARFNLVDSLQVRARWLFEKSRAMIEFKWGRSAEIFAAACVYVAAREANKMLWLIELASVINVNSLYTLTRAIRFVKVACQTCPAETEPALFFERILAHLNTLFASSPSPELHGSVTKSKKMWSPANLAWVRSLSLPEVRHLATGLLAFGENVALHSGRTPEQVACAVVFVAMEGVARRPAPVQQEFCDELAWLFGVKAFTIQERYREYNKLLTEYAPQLPWLATAEFTVPGQKDGKGKGAKPKRGKGTKHELVQYTADIVQFRQAIEAKRDKIKRETEQAAFEEREAELMGKGKGKAAEEDEEDDDYGAEGDEDEDEGAYFDDPLTSIKASNAFLVEPQNNPTQPPADASLSPSLTSTAEVTPVPPRTKKGRMRAKDGKKRPAEYVRGGDKETKRQRVIETVAEDLFSGLPSASTSVSPAPYDSATLSASPPPTSLVSRELDRPYSRFYASPISVAFRKSAHEPDSVRIRQLLLAGNTTSTIYAQLHGTASVEAQATSDLNKPATQLHRRLWFKAAEDLSDDDLFDDGELDSYVRTPADVEAFKRLPGTQEMLRIAKEVEAKARTRPFRNPPRRKRNALFGKREDPEDEAREKEKRANREGAREGRGGSGSGQPRKRKTKMTDKAKAKIEALLAEGGSGSDGEGDHNGRNAFDFGFNFTDDGELSRGGFRPGDANSQDAFHFDLALDVAEDEGEQINEDGDEHEEAAQKEGEGDDNWRATLGYSQQPAEEDVYDNWDEF